MAENDIYRVFLSRVVSPRARYCQQAALVSVAVDNAPDAMVVADRGSVVLYANHAFARLVDKPRSEVVGSRFDFFGHPEVYGDLLHESEGEHSFNGIIFTEKLGASQRWIEVSAASFARARMLRRVGWICRIRALCPHST